MPAIGGDAAEDMTSESGENARRDAGSMPVFANKEIAMNGWQLHGLDGRRFDPLFELDGRELERIGAVRVTALDNPGFPCRVRLEDAAIGTELLLLPFEHHAVRSPYRASGPIYVSRGKVRRVLAPGEVPAYVTRRLISLRAYDARGMMLAGAVCEGAAVATELDGIFGNADVDYVHLHNARQGCYSCAARRLPAAG